MDFDGQNAYMEIVLLLMDSVKFVKEQLLVKYISQTDIDTYLGKNRRMLQTISHQEAMAIFFPRGGKTNVKEWDMTMLDSVFTQLQKDLILEFVQASGMDLKQFLLTHRQGIMKSTIGQKRCNAFSAQNPDVSHWTMTMVCVVLKSAFPQDEKVSIHCLIDATHTFRNAMVHCKKAYIDEKDYQNFSSEITQLIANTKRFLQDSEFNETIDSSVKKIKQKSSAMSLPDAIVALNIWATAQNEIEKKLDQHHEENIKKHDQTQDMIRENTDQQARSQDMIGDVLDRLMRIERATDSDAEPCKYFSCGSEVSSSSRPEVRGTLGGFVFHTHLQSTSVCAIITNHVMRTMVSEDDTMIVDGACIGKLLEIGRFVDVEIAAMEIFGEFVPKCQLAFKDTNGDAKPCNLYDTKTEDIEELNGRHVHIWGASSKPGKGIIACSKYTTTSHAYFIVDDLPGQDEPFSRNGDGGAIVISESIDGCNMTAIGIVLGKMVDSSKEGSYVCSFLQVSLDRISKYYEGTFSIYKGVVKF